MLRDGKECLLARLRSEFTSDQLGLPHKPGLGGATDSTDETA